MILGALVRFYIWFIPALDRALTWAHRHTIGRLVAAGIAHYQRERTARYLAELGDAERRRVERNMRRRA